MERRGLGDAEHLERPGLGQRARRSEGPGHDDGRAAVTLLVLGSPSVDLLHFRGRSERAAGGAALYTALAARRAGAAVTLVGPRPDPMPPELAPAAALLDWRGPRVSPDDLPHFEISHEPGGITTYLKGGWGTASHLTVDDIPADLEPGIACVVPMRDAARRLEIIFRLQRDGWTVGCGTYGGATRKRRDDVLEVLSVADVFFCNESEAATLFGSADRARTDPGKVLYVTLGERGARVIEESKVTHVDGQRVEELDPTGAGDTFCGTTLAHLARGASPVDAARAAVVAAAGMVTGVGPERLLEV